MSRCAHSLFRSRSHDDQIVLVESCPRCILPRESNNIWQIFPSRHRVTGKAFETRGITIELIEFFSMLQRALFLDSCKHIHLRSSQKPKCFSLG